MDSTLLDTDMLSEILKKRDQNVTAAARTYLLHHRRFAFSAMTQYEVAWITGLRISDWRTAE